jgi:transcriptional regulator with XRE-family HTH domain
MPAGGDDTTGDRIARYRKLRGLTQRGLALRANVAYGTLTKVESGHAVAQPAVVAAVARALGIDVDRLTEAVEPGAPGGPSLDERVEPLRDALDAYDLPADDIEPRSVEAVAADVDAVCRRVMRDGVLAPVVGMLSGLLDELVALVHGHAAKDPRAWMALAHAYATLGRSPSTA